MNAYLQYITGVLVCSALFTVFFRIVLYKSVSFLLRRCYLMASMCVSLLIPALQIPVWEVGTVPAEVFTVSNALLNVADTETTPAQGGSAIDYSLLWLSLYVLVVAGLTGSMLYQTGRIYRLKRRSSQLKGEGYDLAVSDEVKSPFSFVKTIYMSNQLSDEEGRQIITHEASHIRHRHSIEKIGMEILKIVMWFNPSAWYASRLLNEVHEFEADHDVLLDGYTVDEYLPTIFKQVFGYVPEISAGLSNSFTKKRFEMMMKKRSPKRYSWVKLLGVLPIATGMFVLFSFSTKTTASAENGLDASIRQDVPQMNEDIGKELFEWIVRNARYPGSAQENGITGTVSTYLRYNKSGEIDQAHVSGSNVLFVNEMKRILELKGIKILPDVPQGEGSVFTTFFMFEGDDSKQKEIAYPKRFKVLDPFIVKAYAPNAKKELKVWKSPDLISMPDKALLWIYEGDSKRQITHDEFLAVNWDNIEKITVLKAEALRSTKLLSESYPDISGVYEKGNYDGVAIINMKK